MLQAKPIKTRIFRAGMDLEAFLVENLKSQYLEGKVIAITSKIVSVGENRFIEKQDIDKEALVRQEADVYLGPAEYGCHLTIKEGLLIPSAGIDESNSENDQYILYPENPFESAQRIHQFLKKEFDLDSFGVLLTDSHTSPLRKGVIGASLAYYGFLGVSDKIGSFDLFGRKLKMTTINVADGLAVAATLVMGEGNECTPLAILEFPVEFDEQSDNSEVRIEAEVDLYKSLFIKAL